MKKLSTISFLLLLWLFCFVAFVILSAIASNLFSIDVSNTTFGKSEIYLIFLISLGGVGIVSFGLAIFITFFKILKSDLFRRIITSPIVITVVILAFVVVAYLLGKNIQYLLSFRDKEDSNVPSYNIPDNNYNKVIPVPTPIPTRIPRKLDGGKLFNLVNEYRNKNGLRQMTWYLPLCEYAKRRSSEVKTDWSHEGYYIEASNSGELYKSICPECYKTGENLARDFYSEEAILQAWINSPTHKVNLDDDWDWGCAMVYSNTYVSMLFGKKF